MVYTSPIGDDGFHVFKLTALAQSQMFLPGPVNQPSLDYRWAILNDPVLIERSLNGIESQSLVMDYDLIKNGKMYDMQFVISDSVNNDFYIEKRQEVTAINCKRVVDSVTQEPTTDVIKVVESETDMTDLCFEFEVLEIPNCTDFTGELLPNVDIYTHPPLPSLIMGRFRTTQLWDETEDTPEDTN